MTPETDGAWADVLWWRNRLSDPCFVYVIRAGGPIKVGVARDVAARLATLQTGNPYVFELLAVLPGAHDLEWQLHDRIKDHQMQGEWFDPPPEFLEFVAGLSERMREAYADDGVAPPWKRQMGEWRYRKRTSSRHNAPVTVRHVEPSPKSGEELEEFKATQQTKIGDTALTPRPCSQAQLAHLVTGQPVHLRLPQARPAGLPRRVVLPHPRLQTPVVKRHKVPAVDRPRVRVLPPPKCPHHIVPPRLRRIPVPHILRVERERVPIRPLGQRRGEPAVRQHVVDVHVDCGREPHRVPSRIWWTARHAAGSFSRSISKRRAR